MFHILHFIPPRLSFSVWNMSHCVVHRNRPKRNIPVPVYWCVNIGMDLLIYIVINILVYQTLRIMWTRFNSSATSFFFLSFYLICGHVYKFCIYSNLKHLGQEILWTDVKKKILHLFKHIAARSWNFMYSCGQWFRCHIPIKICWQCRKYSVFPGIPFPTLSQYKCSINLQWLKCMNHVCNFNCLHVIWKWGHTQYHLLIACAVCIFITLKISFCIVL